MYYFGGNKMLIRIEMGIFIIGTIIGITLFCITTKKIKKHLIEHKTAIKMMLVSIGFFIIPYLLLYFTSAIITK